MDAEETKRWKARNLRYKKPIVRNLNIAQIQEDLWEIQEACEDVRWYTDSEDGTDSLINALAEMKMKRMNSNGIRRSMRRMRKNAV